MRSARVTGEGIDDLLRVLPDRLRSLTAVVELAVPYDRGDVLAAIHREGEVVSTSEDSGTMTVRARLSGPSVGRLREFVVVRGDEDGIDRRGPDPVSSG